MFCGVAPRLPELWAMGPAAGLLAWLSFGRWFGPTPCLSFSVLSLAFRFWCASGAHPANATARALARTFCIATPPPHHLSQHTHTHTAGRWPLAAGRGQVRRVLVRGGDGAPVRRLAHAAPLLCEPLERVGPARPRAHVLRRGEVHISFDPNPLHISCAYIFSLLPHPFFSSF